MPGSTCSFRGLSDYFRESQIELKNYSIMTINKAGVEKNSSMNCNEQVFNANFGRDIRIEHTKEIIAKIIPEDAEITLWGISEGAYIAPDIALSDSRVHSIIIESGGTRSWIEETLENHPSSRSHFVDKFNQIIGNWDKSKSWKGISYYGWNSYHTNQTYESLKKLNLPTLVMLGSKDRNIWFEATKNDYMSLKTDLNKPITLKIFEGANHYLSGLYNKKMSEISAFLKNSFQPTDLNL